MRVLWLTGVIIPLIAESIGVQPSIGGGWITGISNALAVRENVELTVCIPSSIVTEVTHGRTSRHNVNYFLYPESNAVKYSARTTAYLHAVIEKYHPDVVHVFGTEYPRTLSLLECCDARKVVLSITGMVSVCAKHYMGNLPHRYCRYRPLRSFISRFTPMTSLYNERADFEKRGNYEIEALRRARNVIGRTTWDKACTKQINPDITYYHCNETLRPAFYSGIWHSENCTPHTIFAGQAGYPIKGFHQLIEALPLIRRVYPDVRVRVGGQNMLKRSTPIRTVAFRFFGEYATYLHKRLKALSLESCIEFTGPLYEEEMKEEMLRANVFVLPSAIENSPNTLGEAMLLGVPCVASCVGGVQDILSDKNEGFIYPFDEPYMLAYYVCEMFADPERAAKMGARAQKRALATHDPMKNNKTLLSIYMQIIAGNESREHEYEYTK